MLNYRLFSSLAVVGLLSLFACKKAPGEAVTNGCSFSYNPAATEFKWTAFKFTEKVGVGGTFDSYQVSGVDAASSPHALLSGLKFTIVNDSINSANPERDARLKVNFFKAMDEPGNINGEIIEIAEGDTGSGKLSLTLNGIQKTVEFNYKIMRGNEIEIWTSVDLRDWQLNHALESLNEVCKDLHTGKDGLSKLWPDVEIRAFSRLNMNCPQGE